MDASVLFLLVPLAVGLVFAVVLAILLVVGFNKKLEQPGAVPPADLAPGAPPYGRWNAQVVGEGLLGAGLGAHVGVVDVTGRQIAFVPDGAAQPAWQVPCHTVEVRKRGLVNLDGADLELAGPMGVLLLSVSREHLNRVVTNDFKSIRERGYADELIAVLAANGARVLR
ncbi:hypothetical protein F4692_000353 [Nocardioides cavernae]|uniref:Uncharacterized protein n=1 Tax=Nocardioides cavernae TaxID=1921566 RepID=A0A7Y9KQ68_9ACTN|nr:hypothetical protein [Nocardioides cavernae]NYE35249.1 hypothetical protein [Nocardioides cavernae]